MHKGSCRQERKDSFQERGPKKPSLGCSSHKSAMVSLAAGTWHPKPPVKLSTDQVKQLLEVFVYSLQHGSAWKKTCLEKPNYSTTHSGRFLQGQTPADGSLQPLRLWWVKSCPFTLKSFPWVWPPALWFGKTKLEVGHKVLIANS